jgi:putative sigma-54 modulation protein
MQVEIRSRHFNLGEQQREKLTAQLQKLERFSPRAPLSARLTLTHEGGRFTADLAFLLKNSDFRAHSTAIEPELAADEVIENVKTQLRRYKGKITGRPKGEEGGLGRALLEDGEQPPAAPGEDLPVVGFTLKDLSVSDAVDAFRDSKYPFLVFRNSATAKVSVVYQRDDGGFGLLEPHNE